MMANHLKRLSRSNNYAQFANEIDGGGGGDGNNSGQSCNGSKRFVLFG